MQTQAASREELLDRLREFGISVETVDDPILGPSTLVVRLFSEHVTARGTIRADVFEVLKQLRHGIVSLANTSFGDAGIAQCLQFRRVEGLDFSRTELSGVGIEKLTTLNQLLLLKLAGCKLTDADLAPLFRFQALKLLYLNECPITDRLAATVLVKLTALQALKLNKTRISDEGLSKLVKLRDLQYLGLVDTYITDQAAPLFCQFSKLRFLDLSGTQVSRAMIRKLARCLPTCRIVYTPPTHIESEKE